MVTYRRRKSPQKVPVEYLDGSERVEYVGRLAKDLRPELERIQSEVLQSIRLINYLKRKRNSILVSVRVQLTECIREIPDDATSEWMADEIARLSYVMGNSLSDLNTLVNSRIPILEQIRFKLTYGQTPKKRDPATTCGSRADEEEEETDDETEQTRNGDD